jgi:hypothetical protein
MTEFDDVQPTNRTAMAAALKDILYTWAGPDFIGYSFGAPPTGTEIGYPWLSIQGGDRVGYAKDGVLQRGGTNFRLVGGYEPVTEWRVYVLFEWTKQNLTNAGQETAFVVRDNIERAIAAYGNLNDTCFDTVIEELVVDFLPVAGSEFFSVYARLHSMEDLSIEY